MKKWFMIVISFCYSYCNGQSIFFSDDNNRILQLDITSCTTELVVQLTIQDTLEDLATDSKGSIYGITKRGALYQVDINNGSAVLVHTFLFLQFFHALVVDSHGLIITTGSEGFLYNYDPALDKDQFLGDIGFTTVGDLIFYSGNLYATTSEQEIVEIDMLTPSLSKMVMLSTVASPINGLFSFDISGVSPCHTRPIYGLTAEGDLLAINFAEGELNHLCRLSTPVLGATSTYDQSDFESLSIIDIRVHRTQCKIDNGSITIEARGGIGIREYSLDGTKYQADTVFRNLEAGDYKVYVKDANDCIVHQDIPVDQTTAPLITEISTTHPRCHTAYGTLSVYAQGIDSLTYSIDQTNFQDSNYFTDLTPGNYRITVMDTNGCITEMEADIISQELFNIKTIDMKASSCDASNGTLELQLSQEVGAINFSLDGNSQSNPYFKNLSAGEHILQISDEEGCVIDTVINISKAPCRVFIPNAFTPNYDGLNDQFRIYTDGVANVEIKSFNIFDRWGIQLYQASNFSIHSELGWWDGTVNGRVLQSGYYVYSIEVLYDDGTRELLKGQVSLVN